MASAPTTMQMPIPALALGPLPLAEVSSEARIRTTPLLDLVAIPPAVPGSLGIQRTTTPVLGVVLVHPIARSAPVVERVSAATHRTTERAPLHSRRFKRERDQVALAATAIPTRVLPLSSLTNHSLSKSYALRIISREGRPPIRAVKLGRSE